MADCWRWVKGLLYDFVKLKQTSQKNTEALKKAEKVIERYTEDMKIIKQGYKDLELKKSANSSKYKRGREEESV